VPDPVAWDPPSPAVAELIREATRRLLVAPDELFEAVDSAVLASQPEPAVSDRRVAAAIRTSNRANLAHWAAANLRSPGERVAPNLGPETTEIAREIVRRGLDDTSLEAYRVGQNIAWRRWMGVAFELDADPDELHEMLDVSARSIFTFVDETLAGIHDAMERERAQLISRTHSERLEIVNLVLEHAPITRQRASRRLRYELSRRHLAAIIWSDRPGPRDAGELEAAAETLTRATGADGVLTVVPTAVSLWSWFSLAEPPDLDRIRREVGPPGEVRVALGSTVAGIDGFRRSHLQALSTQRLMRRAPELRVAAYADIQLVALATADEQATSEFVAATLGELAGADPVLRETLRTYIRCQFSASGAARALFAHRNTILGRLARAQELLPAPLADRPLEVGLALEIVHWLG
jgi:DNA-binding PucR family transcriptional regulator